jgi:hypothetical protein
MVERAEGALELATLSYICLFCFSTTTDAKVLGMRK